MGADPASSRLEPRTQGTNEVSEEGLPIGFCSGQLPISGCLRSTSPLLLHKTRLLFADRCAYTPMLCGIRSPCGAAPNL